MLNDVHDANSIWSKDSDLKAFPVSTANMEGVIHSDWFWHNLGIHSENNMKMSNTIWSYMLILYG